MFVTLPSNSSMDLYPENKISDFVVHLPKEINLAGNEWEVGLAEIFYPNSWYTIQSPSFYVYYRRGPVDITTTFPAGYYQNASQVIEQLLKTLKQDFEIRNRQLISEGFLTKPVDFLFDINFNLHTQVCEFHFKHKPGAPERANAEGVAEANFAFYLSKPMGFVLGFSQTHFSEVGIFVGERIVDIDLVSAVYVYCDVIEHRTVGHTLAPLLSVIPVEGRSGASISKRFETLQYHRVLKKNISDIRISLRDDQGNLIQFRKGKVLVTLHFRRCKLERL